jgi:small nuclear ribonucleoprotein (snRNP)-like protein
MEKSQAEDYLRSLLNKTLRITTSDTRMFLGQFKCTDSVGPLPSPVSLFPRPIPIPNTSQILSNQILTPPQDRNIILSHAFEYRLPPPPKPSALIEGKETVTLDMTSRYLGLVVVPGEYVTKIEVEEFASQMRGKGVEGLV